MELDATLRPSEVMATNQEKPSCAQSGCPIGDPFSVSHNLIILSPEPDTALRLSALIATMSTLSVCARSG